MSTADPETVFALIRDRPGAAWLDGCGAGWSVLAWDPVEVCTDPADWPAVGRRLSSRGPTGPAPFSGGCLGYLGYGAGSAVAPVPDEVAADEPPVWLGRYRGGLCFRNSDRSWHIGGDPLFEEQASALLERASQAAALDPPRPAEPARSVRTVSQQQFQAGVSQILEWVFAGDCYQVNLTRPVWVQGAGDPWSAYRRLRRGSPAAYGAFLRLDDERVVVSNSPELFLAVDGDLARSRPIKGTAARGSDPRSDLGQIEFLLNSGKDRAELTMIVDLVRNDLGRVAVAGSVETGSRQIETLANVHHAWQEVGARIDPSHDVWDTLAATFPPGSVTGAPKVRACQRIAELEAHPRGVYCGAIGFVDRSGRASWSVAIRTAVFVGEHARYHVGGGIVAASQPESEWEETVAKGAALAQALGVGPGLA